MPRDATPSSAGVRPRPIRSARSVSIVMRTMSGDGAGFDGVPQAAIQGVSPRSKRRARGAAALTTLMMKETAQGHLTVILEVLTLQVADGIPVPVTNDHVHRDGAGKLSSASPRQT